MTSKRAAPAGHSAAAAGDKPIVRALDRGLEILTLLAERRGATLSELADETRIPVASVHRMLHTLQARHFVECDASEKTWRIGVGAFLIGNGYFSRMNVLAAAQPVMEELTRATGETSNLAVAQDGALYYLYQVESDQPIRAVHKMGEVDYMHASGIGKVLLASIPDTRRDAAIRALSLQRHTRKTISTVDGLKGELDSVRQRGWALDDEERHDGMRCIAAPIHGPLDQAVAGVSISGPAARFPDDRLDMMAQAVLEAADRITRRLAEMA